MAFCADHFVAECLAALNEPVPERAMRECVTAAVADHRAVAAALAEPGRAGIRKLHVSPQLTVINVTWGPRMTLMPHNHNMWAIIGVYCGREDNIFWRRVQGDPRGRIEAAGARSLGPGEVQPLGRDIIHSVTNPTSKFTGAIHVYGGDFFAMERSEWDPEELEEHPYDLQKNLRIFEASNASP